MYGFLVFGFPHKLKNDEPRVRTLIGRTVMQPKPGFDETSGLGQDFLNLDSTFPTIADEYEQDAFFHQTILLFL